MYLSVKASGAEQRLVEYIYAIGGGQDDNTAIRAESVHLRQQLVERALAFVVTAHGGSLGTCPSHGVYLINEDDAGRLLLGLAEEIAYARRAHAHKHLYKVGTGQREERHIGFARNGFGQQGLTRSGRAYQQGTLGDFTAQLGELLRLAEKLHNLLYLLFGFSQSGDVLEGHIDMGTLFEELSLRLAHAENASSHATHASAHPS